MPPSKPRQTTPAFDIMINVFAATDGGSALVKFQARYDGLVQEAAEGGEDALELLNIFARAAKMVDLLSQEEIPYD